MILEMAGLPGAGKTSICSRISIAFGDKGCVGLGGLRLDKNWFSCVVMLLRLAASAKPFSLGRLIRAANLAAFLRHYQHRELMIVLDQGVIQKLWSLLADATSYPERRFDQTLQCLKPFSPDFAVWLDTPTDEAVRRMKRRTGGKSRYDGMTEADALLLLNQRLLALKTIYARSVATFNVSELTLDGGDSLEENARKIEMLLAPHLKSG